MKQLTIIIALILFLSTTLLGFDIASYATERYKITRVYDLTNDNEFTGDVTYHYTPEVKIEFNIKNISKKPFTFEQAKYYAVKNDDSIYRLVCEGFSNPNISDKAFIINPSDVVTITCTVPKNLKDINRFFIDLSKERKINFKEKKYHPEEGWVGYDLNAMCYFPEFHI